MTNDTSSQAPPGREVQPWAALVEKIRRNDPDGMEALYRIFSRGVRFYLCRQLGPQDLDDRVHDTFLVVAQAIQRGELREPERLMGYVRTIVQRQVAREIERRVWSRNRLTPLDWELSLSDSRSSPEQKAIQQQNQKIARDVLETLRPQDREVLMRFYLWGQPSEQICEEMRLTETQYRLLKSRAKARFGKLGQRQMMRGQLAATRAAARVHSNPEFRVLTPIERGVTIGS